MIDIYQNIKKNKIIKIGIGFSFQKLKIYQ